MAKKTGLIPISMATLSPGAMLGIDIYRRPRPGEPAELLFSREQDIDWQQLKDDSDENSTFLIDRQDREIYQQYLRENWKSAVQDSHRPVKQRLSVMNEVVRDVMKEQFVNCDTDSIMEATKAIADDTVRLLNSTDVTVQQLFSLLYHDYATFTHSTNVSFYCTLLAKELGCSFEEQHEIAVGGLLHDLGKLKIDQRLLTKPSRLTDDEFSQVKLHPALGLEELADRDDVSFGQLMMVYQHHERLDGRGYPCGLPGDEIHLWAKMCAIADVYEALTSERPYRRPLSLDAANSLLKKEQGSKFDSDMLGAWFQVSRSQGFSHV